MCFGTSCFLHILADFERWIWTRVNPGKQFCEVTVAARDVAIRGANLVSLPKRKITLVRETYTIRDNKRHIILSPCRTVPQPSVEAQDLNLPTSSPTVKQIPPNERSDSPTAPSVNWERPPNALQFAGMIIQAEKKINGGGWLFLSNKRRQDAKVGHFREKSFLRVRLKFFGEAEKKIYE